MKLRVKVDAAEMSYLMYFDSYYDAQFTIAQFLQECAISDIKCAYRLESLLEIVEHYHSKIQALTNMPYLCENENGIEVNDFKNRRNYCVELEKFTL